MSILLEWHAADGTVIPFDGTTGYRATRGALGLDAVTPENTIAQLIDADGAALTNRRNLPRRLAIPLFIKDNVRAQTLVAALADALVGPGELYWTDQGQTRHLEKVIYDGGLAGDQSRVVSPGWRQVVPQLIALDPWWYGAQQSVALPVGSPTAFSAAVAFSAVLPFDGGTSISQVILGSTDAYPVITVQGPATTVTVGSGGLEWSTAVALGASDVLVVDARPGTRGPRFNGGLTDWTLLTEASRLFTLAAGTTSIIAGTTGSSGATTITMQYAPRHRTP